MKLPKHTVLLALVSVLFASCASNTPQGRIEKDPARYGKLSTKDRALVDSGRIRTGMSQDAVYLAWGKPNSVSKGGDGSGSTERWIYTGQTPVWSNQIGYGGRYGGYGRGYGYGYGYSSYGGYNYGSSIIYVPYTAGVVHFRNSRVTKWEESGR